MFTLQKTAVICGFLLAAQCMAETHYVVTNGTPGWTGAVDPYTNWATAGTNIIDVVNAAMTNTEPRLVLVSNGVYYLTNQVQVTNALTIRGVNGRDGTIVDGGYGMPANNYGGCFYLTNAVLDGLTITNGMAKQGGGIYARGGTIIQHCRITGCIATNDVDDNAMGGGIRANYNSVITNCEIVGNTCYNIYAGGAYLIHGALITHCLIASNHAYLHKLTGYSEARGAGLALQYSAIAENCEIYGNVAHVTREGCQGWGGVELGNGGTIRNSLVYNNTGITGGGICIYYTWGVIQNCTVVSNTGAGIWCAVKSNLTGYIENTISYLNTASAGSTRSNIRYNITSYYTGSYHIVNSCIAPTNDFPTSGIQGYYYADNIESDPNFAGKDVGNWRLANDSPCVNAGTNQDWMTNSVDFDGRARIRYGTVDMGAFERIHEGVIYRFH
ncbi:MAG: choice-of-anchor Q domain-containing protein [Kiritimatiellae bacterium]|nr:choice-of-anchor Q domain-containing protein [Kiritimatiellia bacterium]